MSRAQTAFPQIFGRSDKRVSSFLARRLELAFASCPIYLDFLWIRYRTVRHAAAPAHAPIATVQNLFQRPSVPPSRLCAAMSPPISARRRSSAVGGGRLPALWWRALPRACLLTLPPLQTRVIRITVPKGKSEVDAVGGWRREGYGWGVWICGAERGRGGGVQSVSPPPGFRSARRSRWHSRCASGRRPGVR